jgi:hypothetical protein
MNSYDFNQRVLQPWARAPAFCKSLWTERSDVPSHEGPTHHATTETWTYTFPLDPAGQHCPLVSLRVIPALNAQARDNLTGNARWWRSFRAARAGRSVGPCGAWCWKSTGRVACKPTSGKRTKKCWRNRGWRTGPWARTAGRPTMRSGGTTRSGSGSAASYARPCPSLSLTRCTGFTLNCSSIAYRP